MQIVSQSAKPSCSLFAPQRLALPAPKIAGLLPAPRIAGLLPAPASRAGQAAAATLPLRATRVEILLDRDDGFPSYEQIVQAIGPIRTREEMHADLLAIWNGAPRKVRQP